MPEDFSGRATDGSNGGPPDDPRRFTMRQIVNIVVAVALVTGVFTYAVTDFLYQQRIVRLGALEEIARTDNFDRFIDVMRLSHDHFVEEVDWHTLIEGATEGAVKALDDPYSLYYDGSRFESFRINISGQYEGIGVRITEREGYVTVQSPFSGTPGATTPFEGAGSGDPLGLLPGDRIIEVNGDNIVGVSAEQAASIIRGPAGEEVVLTVLREGADGRDQRLTFRLVRAAVEVPTVETRMLDDRLGYLHLLQFTPPAPEAVADALSELRSEGMEALVLDLRRNPGGDLQSSRRIAEMFVPRGPIVHIVERNGDPVTLSSNTDALGIPLVVLIDGGTASASEIVAGAVQDYEVGILVGEKSFGKGSVQQIFTLNNGTQSAADEPPAAGLKVTTARYLTPKERSLDGQGLEPDVVVEWTGEMQFGDLETDAQLRRAVDLLNERLR